MITEFTKKEREEMTTQMIEIFKKIEEVGENEKALPLIYDLKKLKETNEELFRRLFLETNEEKDVNGDYFSIKRPIFLLDMIVKGKKEKIKNDN